MSTFFLHNSEIYGYQIDTSWMTLNANNVITFNPGASVNLSSPAQIGNTTPNTGAFTTLQTNTLQSASSSSQTVVRNGPNGNILATIGGTGNDIAMRGNITLPGGAFGGSEGHLYSGVAPIFQNAAFTGSTTNPAAAFGAFLQQTDNSSNTGAGVGFFEHLILNGPSVVGGRTAGQFNLDINATTGNPSQIQYVGLGSKCNLNATDGSGTSSAFGSNPVASIGPGVTAAQCVGSEINTWIQSGAVVNDRIGLQVVDVLGSTYGVQASRDDVGYVVTNQYAPSSTKGFKIGFSFGRAGGFFPVATNGTLISGQGNLGATWSVANGIDWSLGTVTGYWLKLGSAMLVKGNGDTQIGPAVAAMFGVPRFGVSTSGNQNCIVGQYTNSLPPSTVAFGSGVLGYANMNATGNYAYGVYGQADLNAAGNAVGAEFDTFNYHGTPSGTLPPSNAIGTSENAAIALQVAAYGTYPSLIGMAVLIGGGGQPFQYGMYIQGGAASSYGLVIDADSTHAAANGQALIKSSPTVPNLLLQTKGSGVPANAVFEVLRDDGNVQMSINQAGQVVTPAVVISSPSVPATAASTGVAGTIVWDSGFVYVCIAANTWKRAAISTW